MIPALVYSRARGYDSPGPGDICVLRCRGQTLRVRVTGGAWSDALQANRPGKVRVQYATPQPSTAMGRVRDYGYLVVRAGRLQFVDP